MAKPLIEGFNAYQTAMLEGIGFDSIKRAGRKVIDFCKGIGMIGVCLTMPFLPVSLIQYGQKLYDHYKTDKDYSEKIAELNKAIQYLNTVELKLPKGLAEEATMGMNVFDALDFHIHYLHGASGIGCAILKDGIHKDACETSVRIVHAQHQLEQDTQKALITITNCLKKSDADKSYECKEETLNDIDEAIDAINQDNKMVYQLLVKYSNEMSEMFKDNAKRDNTNSVAGDMVTAKMTDYRSDIPEWETDSKAACDTIHKGPGYWDRRHDCLDNLWK